MRAYVYLAIAILAEVIATSSLKATAEFTRPWPSLLVVAGYVVAFYCLTLSLRVIPVGIAYAIWSGLGIVLVATAGYVLYQQKLDAPALIGLAMILGGCIVINLFSKSSAH
ncbi:multidrug efflux SMR transporter [Archangium sp.]|uniref:DMT family transporter n=1 Tax=Archangium sp. TaxID=1872627 RepID=UPI002D6386B7|nr:multidrug efflux SMR transporter [Archangium sp.]HYO52201.1 multidrug efflux SMR transporter [Archangium sp.]